MQFVRIFFIISILFFSCGIPVRAQTIYFSKEEKFSFQNSDFKVIGKVGEALYTYSASKEGYFLNAYNDSMRMTAKVALDFFPKKIQETRFVEYSDGIIVFYQSIERNNLIQYVAKLDERALLIGRPKAIDSVKTGWFGGTKKNFYLSVSQDKSKILVYGLGKDNLILTLMDKSLELISRRRVVIPDYADYEFRQGILENSGRFYLTLLHKTGSRDYVDAIGIASIAPDEKAFKTSDFHLPEKFFSGAYTKLNYNNGLLYSTAFYATRKNGHIEGIAYFIYDPLQHTFVENTTLSFPAELIQGASEKNKKKAFNDFEVKEILLKNDGGFLLVSENVYSRSRNSTHGMYGYYSWYYSPMYDRVVTEYFYSDILAVDFDATGEVLWHKFIRKEQYSVDDHGLFSSYAFMNTGGSLAFLFNNYSSKTSLLTLAVLDPEGRLQLEALNPGDEISGDWIPRLAKQTGAMQWIIPVLRRDNLYFAKVDFE